MVSFVKVPNGRFTSDRMHLLPSERAAQVAAAEAYKQELRQQIEDKKRRKVPGELPSDASPCPVNTPSGAARWRKPAGMPCTLSERRLECLQRPKIRQLSV